VIQGRKVVGGGGGGGGGVFFLGFWVFFLFCGNGEQLRKKKCQKTDLLKGEALMKRKSKNQRTAKKLSSVRGGVNHGCKQWCSGCRRVKKRRGRRKEITAISPTIPHA